MVRKGAATLEDVALNAGSSWERYAATNAIHEIKQRLDAKLESNEKGKTENVETLTVLIGELQGILDKIIADEKDASLLRRYSNFN